MTFHPWRLLRRLPHVTVEPADLGGELSGCYFPDLDVILLDRRLLQVERRCTLTHELAHRHLGHGGCHDRRSMRREEQQAEDLAARWLIDLDALVDAQLWGRSPVEIADELWVDVPILRARVRSLTDDERNYVNGKVTSREVAS